MNIPSGASQFLGSYTGTGEWVDITGETKQYRISQDVATEANRLLVTYRHDFYQEGNVTEGVFVFEFASDYIFSVKMKDAEVGHGYLFADYLHYNLQVGDRFIEVSYQIAANNLRVRGSSNKNSQGRFIAWTETLAKQAPAPPP